MPTRRSLLASLLLTALAPLAAAQGPAKEPKVLHMFLSTSETGLDPAVASNIETLSLLENVFDPLLRYDYLARPVKLQGNGAKDMPEVSADGLTYTFHIRPGMHFTPDPAFKGQPREVTAADYVYSIKRLYDPALKSPWSFMFEGKLLGDAAWKNKFSYATDIAGLQAVDQYTLRIRLALDEDRSDDARALLATFTAAGASAPAILVATAQRDLLEAELELRAGDAAKTLELAGRTRARTAAGELAPYLRSLRSDVDLIEGLAHLRGGDAGAARPLLDRALATRAELYLPASPRIAEAELALAECDLAQGRRDDARRNVERAAAIEARHPSLARRYTEPLRRLRERLAP